MPVPYHKPRGAEASRKAATRCYDRTRRDRESKRFYHSAAWLKFRAWQLGRAPYCQDCYEQRDDLVEARHVHHLKPISTHPELRLSSENVRSLCTSCHSSVEAKRRGDGDEQQGDAPAAEAQPCTYL